MISLIKYMDIYDKRLCGKARFHYLYVIYKIYSIRKCLLVHKKTNGHEKRSDTLWEMSILLIFFLFRLKGLKKQDFFHRKKSSLASVHVLHHLAGPVSVTCPGDNPAVLPPTRPELVTLLL